MSKNIIYTNNNDTPKCVAKDLGNMLHIEEEGFNVCAKNHGITVFQAKQLLSFINKICPILDQKYGTDEATKNKELVKYIDKKVIKFKST